MNARHQWARTVAVPDAQRLFDHGNAAEAFLLAREALAILPDDPQAQQLWLSVSLPQSVVSEPAGADVAIAAYGTSTEWYSLGRTPLTDVRLPRGEVRMRLVKAGFQQVDVARSPPGLTYRLDLVTAVPPGMVRVAGGRDPRRFGHAGDVGDFWIDRFEVTNRQFKAFVDAGGYQRREYWREPFVDEHRTMTWTEAVGRFRDRTGRPGPATWTSGTYAEGEAEMPVAGVSWYEAMAYAAFAGKRLPTMYHWYRAAGLGRFADILTASNFSGAGPASVGSYRGLGTFGTYDMAGNVKEWCSTATNGRRFLLGGAWNEPRYMFADYDARPPFDRSHGNGFRLAVYPAPPPPEILAPVDTDVLVQSGRHISPVDDVVFEVYRRQYAYDRSPLQIAVEATVETGDWTRHTVSFDAAYGGERVRAYLFIPKLGKAPYQTVIYFPAGDAFQLRSSRDMSLHWAKPIIASGRAFFYPIYKGTYERAAPERPGAHARRDLRIAWARDLGRAIDYLEEQPDIDTTRLAFYGVSAGADGRRDSHGARTTREGQHPARRRARPRRHPRARYRELRAADTDPHAAAERPLRFRDPVCRGTTALVRLARRRARAQAARRLRDRTRAASRRRQRRDSSVARSIPGPGGPLRQTIMTALTRVIFVSASATSGCGSQAAHAASRPPGQCTGTATPRPDQQRPGISFTQWELYLAFHHGKPHLILRAEPEAPRSPIFLPSHADVLSQQAHANRTVQRQATHCFVSRPGRPRTLHDYALQNGSCDRFGSHGALAEAWSSGSRAWGRITQASRQGSTASGT